MENISSLTKQKLDKVEYILHDIDDTITNDGRLLPQAYSALWDLHNRGYKVIPVTGRSGGWCNLIIHQWPVDAIIGENGAFVYYIDKSGKVKTYTNPSIDKDSQKKLKDVEKACIHRVPGCKPAHDQFSRLYDLAIDFNEHVPDLGLESAEKIKQICEEFGAEAKISSIHVNTWFGKYDKVTTAKLFLQDICGVDNIKEKVIFFGDSPNDEPMFEFFPLSCAVSNILPFMDSIKNLPSYVCSGEGGYGFREAVDHILSLK